ncbi:EAL and HDOD domain-containing protein [Aquipuribacter sp. MA13-6]|uniref:EAL and HDOD domain-containing protein n=1 Tax=unclassified Aquipuribacter TaxID=2635084 RepID=UPI003EEC3061
MTVDISTDLSTVLVGRQGIYRAGGGLEAYELLFRQLPIDSLRSEADHEGATAQVISSVFGDFGVADIAGSRPLFLNVTRAFLVGDIALPDAPGQIVVEVLEHVVLDEAVLEGIARLRAAGYRVAADDWDGSPERDPLVRLCDLVKIDLAAVDRDGLGDLVARARELRPGVLVVVERIETHADAALARAAGADLLQGFLLDRPQTVSAAVMTPSDVVCLRLLGALASDADVEEQERLVASDPGLAMRVLRMAGSPAGVGRPVRSVQQAVVLLGPRKLSAWVVLMVLGGSSRMPAEHVVTMLARAGACARLSPTRPDVAYTAGLLSAVAEVLGADPAHTVRSSGVDPSIADAVLRGEGPVGATLRAVVGHERANPTAVVANGFVPFDVSRVYLEALRDALETAKALHS